MALSVINADGFYAGGGATSISFSPSVAFVAGGGAIVVINEQISSAGVGTMTDTAGNTWVHDPTYYTTGSTSVTFQSWHCANTLAGTPTITYTAAQADTYGVFVSLFTTSGGAIAFDSYSSLATGSSTSPVTNSLTPSVAGEIVLAVVQSYAGAAKFSSPTNGFTIGPFASSTTAMSYLDDSSTSSITCGWTGSTSTGWWAGIFAYKPITTITANARSNVAVMRASFR